MTAEDLDAQTATLTDEEAALRDRLRAIQDEIHSGLRRHAHANAETIEAREREIRRIVLRLVQLERERIEITIAESL